MYNYATTFVLIFLTHPGVAYNLFDPGVWGGVVQSIIVLLLQLPSEGSDGFAGTMQFIYWISIFVWAYFKVRMATMRAATSAIAK